MSLKDEMLGKIVRILVTIPGRCGVIHDVAEKLAGENGSGGEWFDNLRKFLCKEPCWVPGVKPASKPSTEEYIEQQKEEWRQLYKKCFGLGVDFTGLKIPEKKDGFDRLIIVAIGVSPNRAYKACEKLFRCYRYSDDLNGATEGRNDREATKDCAIWVRDNPEADKQNGNVSASVLKKRGGTYITLVERMLLEMKYFLETGEHLDNDGTYTMCAGSRSTGGRVPCVCWDRGNEKMCVSWCSSSDRDSWLRAREVVS